MGKHFQNEQYSKVIRGVLKKQPFVKVKILWKAFFLIDQRFLQVSVPFGLL